MIKTGTGKSSNPDAFKAGAEAAQLAVNNIGNEKPDLILAMAQVVFDQEKALQGIKSISPETPLLGGSPVFGVITNEGVVEKEVVVMALKFDKTKLALAYGEGLEEDPFEAGQVLGERLLKECQEPPKFVLIFTQCIGLDMAKMKEPPDVFLRGLQEKIGKHASVFGGGTGDSPDALKTSFQYCNKVLPNGTIAAAGFWGDFNFGLDFKHGWNPIGLPMQVTKCEKGMIFEIDGRPATELYEKYFGKTREEIADPRFFIGGPGFRFPLGVVLENPERIIARQILGATPEGALISASSLPKESTVRLLNISTAEMPKMAKKVAEEAISQLKGSSPQLIFVSNCMTRRLILSPDHEKEIEAVKRVAGEKVPVFGCYSTGEICSKKEEKEWVYHNESMSIAALSE